MGIHVIHLTPQMAAMMVVLMSLANGFGRISWASLSDYLTRPLTYILLFILQIAAFYMLIHTSNTFVFQVLVLIILTCYGGGFAIIPAFIGDVFGTKEAGAIHGFILTAWAAAGLVGPSIITQLVASTGGYILAFYCFIALLMCALLIAIMMQTRYARLKANKKVLGKEMLLPGV